MKRYVIYMASGAVCHVDADRHAYENGARYIFFRDNMAVAIFTADRIDGFLIMEGHDNERRADRY